MLERNMYPRKCSCNLYAFSYYSSTHKCTDILNMYAKNRGVDRLICFLFFYISRTPFLKSLHFRIVLLSAGKILRYTIAIAGRKVANCKISVTVI